MLDPVRAAVRNGRGAGRGGERAVAGATRRQPRSTGGAPARRAGEPTPGGTGFAGRSGPPSALSGGPLHRRSSFDPHRTGADDRGPPAGAAPEVMSPGALAEAPPSSSSRTSRDPGLAAARPRRLLLIGNPNTGKTTLFNRLCGLRAKTANFPGTTTDVRQGRVLLPATEALAFARGRRDRRPAGNLRTRVGTPRGARRPNRAPRLAK